LKFLYKISSGFDQFQPRKIPSKILDGKNLELSWKRYIDSVEVGDEVWVYFFGPHAFTPGVYVNGVVNQVRVNESKLRIRIRSYSTDKPLTNATTSEQIRKTVSVRNRQVSLFPEQWRTAPDCTLHRARRAVGTGCARTARHGRASFDQTVCGLNSAETRSERAESVLTGILDNPKSVLLHGQARGRRRLLGETAPPDHRKVRKCQNFRVAKLVDRSLKSNILESGF